MCADGYRWPISADPSAKGWPILLQQRLGFPRYGIVNLGYSGAALQRDNGATMSYWTTWAYDELVAELAFECCPSGFHANVAKALGDKPKVCVNCGEGHDVKDKKCTKRCDECGSNICPKIRGDVCVVTAEEMPSQHDIKNAAGGRTPDHVYKWLKELRAEKREKMGLDKQAGTVKAAASIADAETNTRFTMW